MVISTNLNPLRLPDFNRDGTTDVFLRSDNNNAIALLDNLGTVKQRSSLPSLESKSGWTEPTLVDFDKDGTTDLFWRNGTTGENLAWLIKDGTLQKSGSLPTLAPIWDYRTGDFNGDSKSDILWHNQATGETVVWLMDGLAIAQSGKLLSLPRIWEAAIADFNGDGKTDIFWRNTQTGANSIWIMDGANVVKSGSLKSQSLTNQYEIVDFNGDGKTDIFWRERFTGKNVVWVWGKDAIGSDNQAIDLPSTPGDWSYQITDFNEDGKTDFFWRNPQSGDNEVWTSDGAKVKVKAFKGIGGF
ncbi:FG-GAP repeat domain-containing protein [Phormidesmis sp. 146-33]